MTTQVVVHKLDVHGREVWRYHGSVLERTKTRLVLEAFFDRPETRVDDLLLRPGDRFVETYYVDRWYNIFAVHDVEEGGLKGWYCNLSRPAQIEPGHVYAEDLALDLVVYPDGSWAILDMEEFSALDLSEQERNHAEAAIQELRHRAQRGLEPFDTR
jgi:hypothetical protein